jgi:hypothetical protein
MSAESEFIVEAFTLLGIAIVFVGLRVVSRWTAVGWRKFESDDYFALLAIVCEHHEFFIMAHADEVAKLLYSIETAAAYIVGARFHGLANNGMTDAERASLDPQSAEYAMRIHGSRTQMVGWNIYTLLLWTLKFCLLGFYRRLLQGVATANKRIIAGYVILAVTYAACALSINLGCHPFHKNWQINPNPGSKLHLCPTPFTAVVLTIDHQRFANLPSRQSIVSSFSY